MSFIISYALTFKSRCFQIQIVEIVIKRTFFKGRIDTILIKKTILLVVETYIYLNRQIYGCIFSIQGSLKTKINTQLIKHK